MTDVTILERFAAFITQEYAVSLNYEGLTLGVPEVYVMPSSNTNTKLVVSGSPGSAYDGSKILYYRRSDLSEVLKDPIGFDTSETTQLSQLLTGINTQYGLDLHYTDVLDVVVPPYDPTQPYRSRVVTITANPESYFYTGTVDLDIAYQSTSPPSTLQHYVYLEGYPLSDMDQSLKAYADTGELLPNFQFLSNVDTVTSWTVSDIIPLDSNRILLQGGFEIVISHNGVLTPTVCSGIVIDAHGAVSTTYSSLRFLGDSNLPVTSLQPLGDRWYGVDSTTHTVRSFDSEGNRIDSITFNTETPVSYIRVYGSHVYTVSTSLAAPTDIYRFNPDGTIDTAFHVVVGSSQPTTIPTTYDLQFDSLGRLYLLVMCATIEDALMVSPTINSIPIVSVNEAGQSLIPWNPVVRLFPDGTLDSDFLSIVNYANLETLWVPDVSMIPGERLLIPGDDGITWMTYRQNPMSGRLHRQPARFNTLGRQVYFQGLNYQNLPQWVNFVGVTGECLVYGTFRPLPIDTSLTPPNLLSGVARHGSDGRFNGFLGLWNDPGLTVRFVFTLTT